MSMPIDKVLAHMQGLKKTGQGRYIAQCPAHADRSPSLAIREVEDGRVLLHCFAGCATVDVLATAGLDFADLYPSPAAFHFEPVKRPWNAYDVLQALSFELLLAWNYAKTLSQGMALAESDRDRLLLCAARIGKGAEVADGKG